VNYFIDIINKIYLSNNKEYLMRINYLERLLNKKYCHLVTSGSTALYLLFKILNIKKKKIIIPANICHDIIMIIIISGNYPLPIDIDKNFSLPYSKIAKLLNNDVAAILYPYMYGNVGTLENVLKIIEIAKKKNIFLIEDVAIALGSKFKKNMYTGSLSDFSICSFGIGKIIDMNYGGSINFNSEELLKKFNIEYGKLKYYSNNDIIHLRSEFNNFSNKILRKEIDKKNFSKKKIKIYSKIFLRKTNFSENYKFILENKLKRIDYTRISLVNKSRNFNKYLKNKYIKPVNHKIGSVYWRKNFFVKKNKNDLKLFLLQNNIYVRDYYPPVNYFFSFLKKNYINSQRFYDLVINFWPKKETKVTTIKKINYLVNKFYEQK